MEGITSGINKCYYEVYGINEKQQNFLIRRDRETKKVIKCLSVCQDKQLCSVYESPWKLYSTLAKEPLRKYFVKIFLKKEYLITSTSGEWTHHKGNNTKQDKLIYEQMSFNTMNQSCYFKQFLNNIYHRLMHIFVLYQAVFDDNYYSFLFFSLHLFLNLFHWKIIPLRILLILYPMDFLKRYTL